MRLDSLNEGANSMRDSMNRKGDSRSIGSSRAEAPTPEDWNLALNVNHRAIDDGRADRFVTSVKEIILGRHWSKDL